MLPPSAVAVAPRATPIGHNFPGLEATDATVASLAALMAGLLRETTNGDALCMAFRAAKKMALSYGVSEEEFDRVKDILTVHWRSIAATDWKHWAFGTGGGPT